MKVEDKTQKENRNGTYKAVEVSTPGTLRVVDRPIAEPGAGQVRIRVEACGIRSNLRQPNLTRNLGLHATRQSTAQIWNACEHL
jgi:hypothetical protein